MNDGEKIRAALLAVLWSAFAWAITVYSLHPIHDGDTWWHLAHGREMLERRVYLRSDIFSFTLNGAPWINFEWLAEIAAYAVVAAFDFKGLIICKAALSLSVVGLFIYLLRKNGASGPWLFSLTWLGYHMLQVRLCTRVELISLFFFPLLLCLIEKARCGRSRSIESPVAAFFLFIVWANTHAAFAYGLALLGCFVLGSRWAGDPKERTTVLIQMLIAAVVGSFVNPWGPKIFAVIVQHALDFHRSGDVLAEWEAPSITNVPTFWICYLIAAGLVVRVLLRRQREAYAWVPAIVLFAVVGGRYLRTTSYLAFVALPFAAMHIKSVRLKPLVQTGFILLAGSLLWFEKHYFVVPRKLAEVDQAMVPAGGVEFLNAQRIEGRMFNSYMFGGYLEWACRTSRPVFMDGRYIFYSLVERYHDVMMGKSQEINAENWAHYFDGYGIDHALVKYEPLRLHRVWNKPVPSESAMSVMFPTQTWALVYWNDACLVFLKRIPKFESVILANEYKTVRPYDIPAAINQIADDPSVRERIENDLQMNEKRSGPTRRAHQIRLLARH